MLRNSFHLRTDFKFSNFYFSFYAVSLIIIHDEAYIGIEYVLGLIFSLFPIWNYSCLFHYGQKWAGCKSQWRSWGTLRPGARNILAPPFNKTYRVWIKK